MTVSKFTIALFFFVLLFSANEFVYAQKAVCRVTVFSIDSSTHQPSYSDSVLVAEFNLKVEDNPNPKTFQHKESGVIISVNAMQIASQSFEKKPTAIRLTIQLYGLPDDSYSFYGGATESILDRNWRGSLVSSHIRTASNKGFTFTFACEKSKKRDDK